MTREEKVNKKINRAKLRASKNNIRNKGRKFGTGNDCPYDVDINGLYGTCNCGGVKYADCLGDI